MTTPSPQRIQIIGASGAGKTTLGRAIAGQLASPFADLDDLWWSPGWVGAGHEELQRRLAPLAAAPRWVVAGNYFASTERVLWPRLQWLIAIDLPLGLLTRRLLWRTVRRGLTGEPCCNGNREQLHRLWHREGVLRYTWRHWSARHARFARLADEPALAHVQVTRLSHPGDAARLLASLGGSSPATLPGSRDAVDLP